MSSLNLSLSSLDVQKLNYDEEIVKQMKLNDSYRKQEEELLAEESLIRQMTDESIKMNLEIIKELKEEISQAREKISNIQASVNDTRVKEREEAILKAKTKVEAFRKQVDAILAVKKKLETDLNNLLSQDQKKILEEREKESLYLKNELKRIQQETNQMVKDRISFLTSRGHQDISKETHLKRLVIDKSHRLNSLNDEKKQLEFQSQVLKDKISNLQKSIQQEEAKKDTKEDQKLIAELAELDCRIQKLQKESEDLHHVDEKSEDLLELQKAKEFYRNADDQAEKVRLDLQRYTDDYESYKKESEYLRELIRNKTEQLANLKNDSSDTLIDPAEKMKENEKTIQALQSKILDCEKDRKSIGIIVDDNDILNEKLRQLSTELQKNNEILRKLNFEEIEFHEKSLQRRYDELTGKLIGIQKEFDHIRPEYEEKQKFLIQQRKAIESLQIESSQLNELLEVKKKQRLGTVVSNAELLQTENEIQKLEMMKDNELKKQMVLKHQLDLALSEYNTLNEIHENLLEKQKSLNDLEKPFYEPYSDREKSEIDMRLKADPVGTLREGIILIFNRITETGYKTKKDLNLLCSSKFDKKIQDYCDLFIIPSLMQIVGHEMVETWVKSNRHFWKVLEILAEKKNDEFCEGYIRPLVEQAKKKVDTDSKERLKIPTKDDYLRCFFVDCIGNTGGIFGLFNFFEGFVKQEDLLNQWYKKEAILRNVSTMSKIRKLVIAISKLSITISF